MIVLQSQSDLFKSIETNGSPGCLSHRMNRWQQHGGQYAYNSDDHQQFRQCESAPIARRPQGFFKICLLIQVIESTVGRTSLAHSMQSIFN